MKIKLIAALLFCFWILTGCSNSSYDPTQIPSTMTISFYADKEANINEQQIAGPVELQLFELEDESMFMSADYDHLLVSYKKTLKNNYLRHYDYVVTSENFKFVDALTLDKNTNYVAVMVRFNNPDMTQWKKILRMKAKGHQYHLLVFLKKDEVILQRVE